MTKQPAIEPRKPVKAMNRPKRASVTLPPDLNRQVTKFAKSERRLFASALVVLIEKGLGAARE